MEDIPDDLKDAIEKALADAEERGYQRALEQLAPKIEGLEDKIEKLRAWKEETLASLQRMEEL